MQRRQSPLEYLTRPARKQVERKIETHAANGVDYNIWYIFTLSLSLFISLIFRYGTFLGQDKETKRFGSHHFQTFNFSHLRERALTRCKVDTDSGYTKGDKLKNTRMCLFFARGCCHLVSFLYILIVYLYVNRERNAIFCTDHRVNMIFNFKMLCMTYSEENCTEIIKTTEAGWVHFKIKSELYMYLDSRCVAQMKQKIFYSNILVSGEKLNGV